MSEHVWLKAHAMVGTKTNVITSVNVTGSDGADSPEMTGLITSTGKHFKMAEERRRCPSARDLGSVERPIVGGLARLGR